MKKEGKTTRPFRYDLNQIPYNYTVEVRNRFKGLNLIDRVPDELGDRDKDHLQEKETQKKQNGGLRRPYKQQCIDENGKAKEKRKDTPI